MDVIRDGSRNGFYCDNVISILSLMTSQKFPTLEGEYHEIVIPIIGNIWGLTMVVRQTILNTCISFSVFPFVPGDYLFAQFHLFIGTMLIVGFIFLEVEKTFTSFHSCILQSNSVRKFFLSGYLIAELTYFSIFLHSWCRLFQKWHLHQCTWKGRRRGRERERDRVDFMPTLLPNCCLHL